ncbi:MAG: hypothetical protein C0507_08110 [Cyanobacteria bacterium PR.3.49]|jgi:hypothetical protein|nr:hypothetical protein [Cyanobacteria bacterium PR.3.49]
MSGQNRYEPSLEPQAAVNEVRPEEEVQANPISYDNVMTSSQSAGRRDVTNFTDRTDLSTVQDQSIREALTLVDNAKAAALLLTLKQSGQPDSTQFQMQDSSGRPFTVTLGQVKQSVMEELSRHSQFKDFNDPAKLREFIAQQNESALTLSQRTRETYEAKSRETDTNVNARNELAAKLGFQPTTREIPDGKGGKTTVTSYDVTPRAIETRLATTTDAGQRAELEKLKGLLTNYDSIQKERNALSKVDVVAAQLMMSGLTHKEGEQTLPGMPATRQEVMRAYETINRAGRGNAQLEVSPQFQAVKDQSTAMYSDIQLQRSRDAVIALQAADQLRVAGKVTEAQAQYEEALKKVKEVDMATITTQWQSQMKEFNLAAEKLNALGNPPSDPLEAQRLAADLQQKRDIGLQLEQIIQVGKEVKVQYAAFLNEQGKPNEAMPLLTSVASSTPQDLLAGDKTFEEQLEKSQSMGSITSGDAEKHRVLYEQAMASKDWSTAERELAALKAASTQASEQSIQGAKDKIAAMSKRQTEIDTEIAELKRNSTLSEEAKALRQEQLTNEKNGYDALRKNLEENLGPAEKAAQEHQHQLRYMEGVIAFSKDDKETAHKIFKELEAEAPEIAANKEYQLEGLIEDTRKKGWWERNWDTIVGVAKIAAIGVAIAAAGAVTGGVGAVLLTGALVGGGLTLGIGAVGHGVAQAKGWKSTDNYHNWRPVQDFALGAASGAGGAGLARMFASGGMMLAGKDLAASSSLGIRTLGYGMQGAQKVGTFAFSKVGAPVTGSAYGFGSEGLDYMSTGKFNINEAFAKSASATAGIYGARMAGGFGTFTGQVAYAGVQTGGDLLQNRYMNGQSWETASGHVFGDAMKHLGEAAVVGGVSNINSAAAAHRLSGSQGFTFTKAAMDGSRLQNSASFLGATFKNVGVEGRMLWSTMGGVPADVAARANVITAATKAGLPAEAINTLKAAKTSQEALTAARGFGLADETVFALENAIKPIPTWQKVAYGTAGTGLVGMGVYGEQNAYDLSREKKELNDPDPANRIHVNSNFERWLRQVKKPVVQPTPRQGG